MPLPLTTPWAHKHILPKQHFGQPFLPEPLVGTLFSSFPQSPAFILLGLGYRVLQASDLWFFWTCAGSSTPRLFSSQQPSSQRR